MKKIKSKLISKPISEKNDLYNAESELLEEIDALNRKLQIHAEKIEILRMILKNCKFNSLPLKNKN